MTAADVHVDFDANDGRLSLSSSGFVLLVEAAATDLLRLAGIGTADWASRRSVEAGSCLGHPVFWAVGETSDSFVLLVGADDETWNLSLIIPTSAVHDIAAAAATQWGNA